MSEQFTFDECAGQGGAVDPDERAILAKASAVDGSRYQFLAGTGLSEDQYGGVGRSYL